jgi:hypothetical protein
VSLYAFDALDDAFESTRSFLWPFDLGRWARLALIVFFVGGGSAGFNSGGSNFGGTGGGPGTPGGEVPPGAFPEIGGPELAVILAIVGVIALIVLLFLLVGSIMEFVLVESLRREDVTIRRYWSEHWGKGLRLFAFRLVFGLVALAIAAATIFLVLAPVFAGRAELTFGLVLLAIPVFLVLAIVGGLINGFTTVFVVPVMIAEDRGLLSAWSRFWSTMTGQWKQYLVYAIMGFVLQLAGGIVVFIVGLIGLVVLAIPLGIVGVIGFTLAQSIPVVGWPIVAVAALLFVIGAILIFLFVSVPVQTFLRYYALFVLGDTNEAFDLIPERRRAVREGDASPSDAPA